MRILSALVTKLSRPHACWRERLDAEDINELNRMCALMASQTKLPPQLYPR